MCELFGFTAKKETDIRDYLRLFYSHSPRHPHGWGLVWQKNAAMKIMKEPVQASNSEMLGSILSSMQPQKMTIAHIRFATIGSIRPENCHPYSGTDASGRKWYLMHNGTIYSGKRLVKYIDRQNGDTDSERIFLYLMDEINAELQKTGRPLTDIERFCIISKLAAVLSPRNKLNLLIYDGDLLYVHKNMKGTLHYLQKNDSICFSTEPLDDQNWKSYPLAKMCAFKDGQMVFEGVEHGNIFVPNLDYITKFAAMHI